MLADRSNVTSLDMATILASRLSDVTGGIPDALQRLSEAIVDGGCKDEFVALKPLVSPTYMFDFVEYTRKCISLRFFVTCSS